MYAIVEIGGKQYRVKEDDLLFVPHREEDKDKKLTFDRVLLVSNGDDISVGTPTVDGAVVKATVVEHVRADKVLVFKKKRRKRYRVKRGHRQPYTQIRIESVTLKGGAKTSQSKATKEAPETDGPPETPVAEAPVAKAKPKRASTAKKTKKKSAGDAAKS